MGPPNAAEPAPTGRPPQNHNPHRNLDAEGGVCQAVKRFASFVLGALELFGVILFMVVAGWILLAFQMVAGAAGARGVR